MNKSENGGSRGNASNPPPENGNTASQSKSLLNSKAETYLREGGNIEDMPDPREEQDAEDLMRGQSTGASGSDS